MGMATNIMIGLILFSWFMKPYCEINPDYAGSKCPFNTVLDDLTVSFPQQLKDALNNNLIQGIGLVLAIVGTLTYPNPYVIFIFFLGGILAFPYRTIIENTPGLGVVGKLIGSIYGVAFFLAVLTWYKSGIDIP